VVQTGQAWTADIRRTRHIGDFSRWKDHKAFECLLWDLKAESWEISNNDWLMVNEELRYV
jgi:hypothetical protein